MLSGRRRRLQWLDECRKLGIPLDLAIKVAPLIWHVKNGDHCTCPNDDYHDRLYGPNAPGVVSE